MEIPFRMSRTGLVRLRDWKHLRLYLAVMVPVSLGLLCASLILDYSSRSDEETELTARGRLVAVALAESAQYDFLQGDKDAARRSMQAILEADPTVRQIVLLDAGRTPLLAFGDLAREGGYVPVEVPTRQVDQGHQDPQKLSQQHSGFVRVYMASPSLAKSKQLARAHAQVALLVSSMGALLIGIAIAQRLRDQVDAALQAMSSLAAADSQPPTLKAGTDYGPFRGPLDALGRLLQQIHHRMQEQLTVRTRDLNALVSDQARRTQDKERLLVHDHQVIEKERARIAQEVHDRLGGGIVSARLHVEALGRKASKAGQLALANEAAQIKQQLDAVYADTRDIAQKLRPEVLELLGLRGAVQELVRQLDETHPDCSFNFQADDAAPTPDSDLSIVAFRVVQEALTNIVKHARAKHVDVTLAAAEPPRRVRVVVVDDGVGLAAGASSSGGMGMMSMRERVERAGGVLSVTSGAEGTALTFVI